MRKSLLILCLLLNISSIRAQQRYLQETKRSLLKTQEAIYRVTHEQNKAAAIQLARKRDWPIFEVDKEGRVFMLQGLDPTGLPIYLVTYNNSDAAKTIGTASLWPGGSTGFNLSGSSNFLTDKLSIWDGGGILANHIEFAGRVLQRDNPSSISDHATHVTGTMVAAGINPAAKGMAFGLQRMLAYDFDNDSPEMAAEAASGLLVSNHSYGFISGWDFNTSRNRWEWWGLEGADEDYKFGYYDQTAQEWDQICFNAPYYLPVKSAGNSRNVNGPDVGKTYWIRSTSTSATRTLSMKSNDSYDIISTTGTAKNILTVGAVNLIPGGYFQPSDGKIADFSSWGPTDDGRIKPDIVTAGVNIVSTTSATTTSYGSRSGTSMAAPSASGSLLLLQELYAQHNNGNYMRSATLKGLVIETAEEAGNAPGPDYVYGWGLMNTAKAAQVIATKDVSSLIEERTLAQGQLLNFDVIASGNGPLKATLCWTDPETEPIPIASALNNSTPRLINDLDLRIDRSGTTYMPWLLTPANPALAAITGDNTRDNVEQVVINNTIPGQVYRISISHKNILTRGPQAFSLIVTGTGGNAYCSSAPTSTNDSKLQSFQLSGTNFTSVPGCTGYTDQTASVIDLEVGKTYPFTLQTGTCGSSFDKIAKIFIDWNTNGVFEASETIYTSPLSSGNDTFNGSISIPSSVSPQSRSRLRIVLSESSDPASISPCGTYSKGESLDFTVNFLPATIDASITAIHVPPLCKGQQNNLSIVLKNQGTDPISNIPFSVNIYDNQNSLIANKTGSYSGTLNFQEEVELPVTINYTVAAGLTYRFEATAQVPNDQIPVNDTYTQQTTISSIPTISNPLAVLCDNTGQYFMQAQSTGTVFWYQHITDPIPFTAGDAILSTVQPVNNTFYVGVNDFSGIVGAHSNQDFSSGGYNQYTPEVHVHTAVPVILQSARLYIGNSGKIRFTARKSNGQEVSSVVLNVTATVPNPVPGPVDGVITSDQGQVYYLGLVLPDPGDYFIDISYEGTQSTIFRHNTGVMGYPFNLGNIFSIEGANVNNDPSNTSFYYYFYDLNVKSLGCSDGTKTAVAVTRPVITQIGNILSSSFTNNIQWYLNGTAIAGATSATFTPVVSGNYMVKAVLATGCIVSSANHNVLTSTAATPEEKRLMIYPVPTSNTINISLDVLEPGKINVYLINALGQLIYSKEEDVVIGNWYKGIDLASESPGVYFVKVKLNKKTYRRKIILTK